VTVADTAPRNEIGTLPPEAELVLRLCRPRPTPGQLDRAAELLTGDFDPGRLVDHAARHRVLPAVWAHIARLGPRRLANAHRQLARAMVLYNGIRAEALRREFQTLRDAFTAARVQTLVRKGMYLAWEVYPDPFWRYMSDLDFLVPRGELGRAKEVMHGLGYRQGALSADDRTVTPITREVEAFWLLNTSSVPAFIRPTSEPSVRAFQVDLRHHILEPSMGNLFDMAEWYERGREVPLLGAPTRLPSREDFFVDLCVHLYREAVTLTTVQASRDLSLRKFVDVAEVLATPHAAPDPAVLVERVRGYGLTAAVYFTLAHTESLLPGSVDVNLLRALDPGDHGYLDEYGGIDGQPGRWDDPIAVRVFDYQRGTAIDGRSRLLRSR
jgi:hypothetical protein